MEEKFLSTQEVVNFLRDKGVSVEEFIAAVKSGEISPCWVDGHAISEMTEFEDIAVALQELAQAQKAN